MSNDIAAIIDRAYREGYATGTDEWDSGSMSEPPYSEGHSLRQWWQRGYQSAARMLRAIEAEQGHQSARAAAAAGLDVDRSDLDPRWQMYCALLPGEAAVFFSATSDADAWRRLGELHQGDVMSLHAARRARRPEESE